jgi:hypothetical protein
MRPSRTSRRLERQRTSFGCFGRCTRLVDGASGSALLSAPVAEAGWDGRVGAEAIEVRSAPGRRPTPALVALADHAALVEGAWF